MLVKQVTKPIKRYCMLNPSFIRHFLQRFSLGGGRNLPPPCFWSKSFQKLQLNILQKIEKLVKIEKNVKLAYKILK